LSNPCAAVCSVVVQFAAKQASALEVKTDETQMHGRSVYEVHPATTAAWVEHETMQAVIAPDSAGVTPDAVVEAWAMAKAGRRRAVKIATRMMNGFGDWSDGR